MTQAVVPARLNVVTLGVRNLPMMRHFYESMGWKATSVGDEWARLDTGGATLALFGLEPLAAEAGMTPPRGNTTFKGFTLAACVEKEPLLDEAISAARRAGARVVAEPQDRGWGGRSGYFADPEGNVWEIAWVPGASYDEAGTMTWPSGDDPTAHETAPGGVDDAQEGIDEDLRRMSVRDLRAHAQRLREGIRSHRDSKGHELCWHHPRLWGLLPEEDEAAPVVPDWPQFMRGCIRYRESLDRQLPDAPRSGEEAEPPS